MLLAGTEQYSDLPAYSWGGDAAIPEPTKADGKQIQVPRKQNLLQLIGASRPPEAGG